MTQNIYDNENFFSAYAGLSRSVHGLDGAPEWPKLKAMLPDLKGAGVIDLGCGYGWFCRYAREQGAARVTGVDVSRKMLAKAEEMTDDSGISYQVADLETLALVEDAYDLVYSSLTLHYIVQLPELIERIYRSLVPGGAFVFSAEHPIYTGPSHPDWTTDADGRKSWPVNDYQKEGKRVRNWLADGVVKQHRTLGTYINLLVEKGFTIRHLDEWGPTAEQIAAFPALDEEKERPMIFLMSVTK